MANKNKFPTRCVHEGEIKDTMYQGIVSPLFMSTTYPWFGGDSERNHTQGILIHQIKSFYQKKLPHSKMGRKHLFLRLVWLLSVHQ